MASAEMMANCEERRLWIGNLDTRITEYQLLKIVQQCGKIEKFDMLFHKSGPQVGQPRGYAFVTYKEAPAANRALDKLNGHQVGRKTMVIRLAKNINYDELEKPKVRLDIPALAAGGSSGSIEPRKMSTEITIQAIEAKLKALENNPDDLEINQSANMEPPIIHKYQYNKNAGSETKNNPSNRYTSKSRYTTGPYNKRYQQQKR